MKIICVAYLHGSGGAERQIIKLANNLSRRGHFVSIVVLGDYNKKYDIDNNVNVIDLTYVEKNNCKLLSRYNALKKIYKKQKPDLTIHYWLQSAYLTSFIKKKLRGQIIYSERGDPSDLEYNGLLGLVRKISFIKIDGFVFQSERARNYFSKRVIKKSIIIHNSVNIDENKFSTPCNNREKKIISVGRLHQQKNQILLIKAFEKICNEFPEYCLEIYGDGPLKDELNRYILLKKLENRIYIKKPIKEIFNEIYSSELFVLSSNYEGMPNALLEAMALGVPSITTDYKPGGVDTLIINGINGWIVPANDLEKMSNTLKLVLKNKDICKYISNNAIEIRKSHSDKIVFDLWNDFINKVTKK